MIVLAFETSAQNVSVALLQGEHVLSATLLAAPGKPAGDGLLPATEKLLAEAGVARSALDGIAFGAGPGAFTGLRLGCAAAQGLGYALRRPLLAVGSLDALAASETSGNVVCAIDARLGELYLSAFALEPGRMPRPMGEVICVAPSAVPDLGLADWVGVGNGFGLDPAMASRLGGAVIRIEPERMPHAEQVARLGARMLVAGQGVDPAAAAPLYVRNKVAKTTAERVAEGLKA